MRGLMVDVYRLIRATPGFAMVALVSCAGLAACGDREPAPRAEAAQQPPREVRLVPVSQRAADRFVEFTGTVYGDEEVLVAAKVPGRIVAVHKDLGDSLMNGEPLARVDPTDYRLELDEARAQLMASLARIGLTRSPDNEVDLDSLPVVARAIAEAANATARLERARKLFERTPPLMSEQDFADIQTQSEVARTNVESERLNARSLLAEVRVRQSAVARAEQRLKDADIVAPPEKPLRFRVARRQVSVGEFVREGDPLFRLVASDRVKCRGLVPERFAGQVRVGADVVLNASGAAGEGIEAKVTRVSPAVDITTRSFEVEVEAENPTGNLKPGGFVRGRILTIAEEGVRFVPRSAVVQFAGVSRVMSVKDGKIVEHRVRVQEAGPEEYEVTALPRDVGMIVASPARGLASGVPVKVLGTASAE